ncbi:putative NBD/HSP70 family sugar kinase [Kibdelosporangium banguiense]|uniref:NBD/HSP70 family sugar kinase n=1 Tax=Kibdelosporangium banguiense TaxID=1365924 RepID=A0ABS4TJW4_9PSEU|nr:ROK family transcriptional regulator [Kibdelosporangium banguiense]MBP2324294.1 putative NBD/HSP70 family sugar kinase [Kibdelosporangium banguiense]
MLRSIQQTTRDLRRHNRSALLSRLYLDGPGSRLELVRASGLSSATVSNVISDLINDGMVTEAGSVDSDGGRPRTLLQVRSDYGYVVGVDIGETHVEVGLFDCTLNTVGTATYPIADTKLDPGRIAQLVIKGITAVTVDIDPESLLGVGVGVPGAVLSDGLVHAPTLQWSGVPLASMLTSSVDVPLYVDNCARTLGQAEMWRGAGRNAGRAVVALLGVGVGAAVATGSDSYRSATSTTCEWGHTVIQVGGAPCRCGSHGCLEAYIGAESILKRYGKPFTATDTESKMAELVAATDQAARDAIAETVEYLGIGIANLVNMLNPDRVVLSGWVSAVLGPAILPAVRDAVKRHTLPYLFAETGIELGQLGNAEVALGAATLPVLQLLATGARPA